MFSFFMPRDSASLALLHQMTVFAMYWHEELWLDHRMQEFQFLLAGVPGIVNIRDIGVDHLRALFKELIDDIGYGFFIAWDRCRGQDDRIAFFELHSLMLAGSDARQG